MKLTLTLQEMEAINIFLKKFKRKPIDEMVDAFPFIKQDASHTHFDFEVSNIVVKKIFDTINKCIDDLYNPITILVMMPILNKIKRDVLSIEHVSSATKSAVDRLRNLNNELIVFPESTHEWRVDGRLITSYVITAHSCDVKVDHAMITQKIIKEIITDLSVASTEIRLALNDRRKFISPQYAKRVDLNLRRIDDAISHFNLQYKKLTGVQHG